MRTTQQILAEMDAAQSQLPELASLNTTSTASVFGWLKNLWTLFVQQLETFVAQANIDTLALIDSKQIGTVACYAIQAKLFQLGSSPTVLTDGRVGYSETDASRQIIKQAVCVEDRATGQLKLKVAKASGTALAPLNEDELRAFKEYVALFKFAGVAVNVVSIWPEQVQLSATIRLNRQVVKANGESLSAPGTYPVVAAIQAYTMALPFDSVFSWTGLTDYMQTQVAVTDFVVTASAVRDSSQNPSGATSWAAFTGQTESKAGYLELVLAESTITYL